MPNLVVYKKKIVIDDHPPAPRAKRIGMFELAPCGDGFEVYSIRDHRSVVFTGTEAWEARLLVRQAIERAFQVQASLAAILPPIFESFFRR